MGSCFVARSHMIASKKAFDDVANDLESWLDQSGQCEPVIAGAINKLRHYSKNEAERRFGKDLGSLDPEFFTLGAGHPPAK